MTPKSLFNIIIKIFGLLFLREIVNSVPQLISFFMYFEKPVTADGVWALVFSFAVMALYVILVYLLLFRTNYFVTKLKLDQGFDQETFSFDISAAWVLRIALIVIGGLLLVNEVPNFCRQVYVYFQERRLTFGMTKPDISLLIIAGVKVIIGLLIIGERNRIAGWIESREKKNSERVE